MVIALDFDGTVVKNKWPEIGEMRWLAKPVLPWLSKRHLLVLNTCREGELLNQAVDFLIANGIAVMAANENLKERIEQYGGDCRKISADLYLDDKGFFPGWLVTFFVVLWMEWREKRERRIHRKVR